MALTKDQALELAAPMPPEDVFFRIQSTAGKRADGYRMVRYTTRHGVRRRLNSVIPGEWSYTFEPLVREEDSGALIECRGVIWHDGQRYEGLGTAKGKKERPKKSAREISKECVGDGFKLAAVNGFGIAADLYTMPKLYHHVADTDDGVNERELDDLRAIYAEQTGQPYTRKYDAPEKRGQQQTQRQQQQTQSSSTTTREPDMSRDDFLKELQTLGLPVPTARSLIGVESFEGMNLRDALARVKEANAKAHGAKSEKPEKPEKPAKTEKTHDGPAMSDDDRATTHMIAAFKAEIERGGTRDWSDLCMWIPTELPSKHSINQLTVGELKTIKQWIADDDAKRATPNFAPPDDLELGDGFDVVGEFTEASARN